MEYLQDLNPQQKKAALEEHKLICVIAGPGCGKTKTLISRIIYLLAEKKIEPRQVLVLTFAKKAIKEIKKRIYPYIAPTQKSELNIYNFHSFCYTLLSKHASLLGFPENKFPVYDRHDQENIIKKIVYNLNYQAEQKEISTILSLISRWKNRLEADPSNLTETDRLRYQIYQEYQKYLTENQALDFNDLLLYTIKLFTSHPEIKKVYQQQFLHVLVDEFQDVNDIQWEIVQQLTSKEQNLFLVGDPNQAIYGFQGASPHLISSLVNNKEWKVIYLNINYRSTNNILSLANSFISKNDGLLINNLLIPTKQEGAKIIQINRFPLKLIVRRIRWLLAKEKIQFSDIAFLYRNNYLSMRIEQELVTQKIPYEILGAFKFIEREEIKDVLAFLRAILYQDNLSFLRVLNLVEGIGSRTIEKIEINSQKQGDNIYQYLNNYQNIATEISPSGKKEEDELKLNPKQTTKICEFILKVNNFRDFLAQNKKLSSFLPEILEAFVYWKHLEIKTNPHERKKNVQQLLNIAQSWERRRKIIDNNLAELLNAFLQYFMIAFEDRKLIKTRNNLILSSVHQAKGLEFEVVFFAYLDEGTLPYKENKDLVEEKRLFYVGITRAKRLLFLISSKPDNCSSFLEEIDKEFIQMKLRN
jgi:DNA helicase-2/ATP-dependent DNA helicase PcrA